MERFKNNGTRDAPTVVSNRTVASVRGSEVLHLEALPAEADWPEGPHKRWIESLQRPDNHKNPQRDKLTLSCCGGGDVVKTKFRVWRDNHARYPEDRWYAWLNDTWVLIPPDKIVPDYAPDGQAYLFVWAVGSGEFAPLSDDIVCFVRPKGGI